VTVAPPPPATVIVTVQTSAGQPISGADVAYIAPDGTRTSGTTGNDGTVSLAGLPDGTDVVYAYANGFLPTAATVTVQGGGGQAIVQLSSGQVATTSLTSQQLTEQEIIAAGIDPNDPANQVVFQFEVHLAFWPDGPSEETLSGYINSNGEFVGDTGGGGGGGGGGIACSSGECRTPAGTVVPYMVDGHPMLEWLIFGGKASFLKQFFRLTLLVQNLSPDPFNFTRGRGQLNLPVGLSLAPTSTPQSLTQPVPDIPGDGSASVNWLVRGDTPGSYQPSAEYTATLQPVGAPLDLMATLQDPLQVFGADAVKLNIDADATATDRYPYHLRIGLTNTAPSPIYNAQIQLDPTKHVNFLYQPQERLTRNIDTIQPGRTVWTDDFILAPSITGTLDVPDSYVLNAAGEQDSNATITSHPTVEPPSTAPAINATSVDEKVELSWAPVSGASSYRLFVTPDRNTPFGDPVGVHLVSNGLPESSTVTDVPPSALDSGTNQITVRVDAPLGVQEWYAVSSVINGVPTLVHPLIPATATITPPTVSTRSATEVLPGSATLNGFIDPAGATLTNCHFEFGTGTSYGKNIPCAQTLGAGALAVSAPVTVLTQGTTYHFRVAVDNGSTHLYGDDFSFTTPVPGKPTVVTEDADSVTNSGATLRGTVTPNGFNVTDCHFDYGIGNFGQSVPCEQQPGSGFAGTEVTARLNGLQDGQTYQFRVSATNSVGTTTGDVKTFSVCDSNQLSYGAVVALGCFVRRGANSNWESAGTVRVNGIDFVPDAGGKITIEPAALPVLRADGSGHVSAKFHGMTWDLQDWSNGLDLTLGGKTTFTPPGTSNFDGVQVVGSSIAVDFNPDAAPDEAAKLTATLSFGKVLGDSVFQGTAEFKTSNSSDGLEPEDVEFSLGDAGLRVSGSGTDSESLLFGHFPIQEVRAKWSAEGNIWSIGAKVGVGSLLATTPEGGISDIAIDAEIGFMPLNPFVFPWLDFAYLKAGVDGLNKPLADGIFLQSISAELHVKPHLEIGGGIGLSFGPKILNTEALDVDGDLLVDFGPPVDVKATGDVKVVGTDVANGFLEFKAGTDTSNPSVTAGGNLEFNLGPVSATGHVSGAAYPQLFQLGGNVQATVFGIGLFGSGIISNAGVGACGHISIGPFQSPDIGFKDHWGQWPQPSGCDFGDLQTINQVQASSAAGTIPLRFRIPRGLSRAEFAAVGASVPPNVTLISPAGTRISTPTDEMHPAATSTMLALSETQTKTTYFFVNRPASGVWRIVPQDSTSRPVRIERAYPLPKAHVSARLLGRGRLRTLSWRLAPIPGQTVTFIEKGATVGRVIATVRAAHGTLRFEPVAGSGGSRQIIASVQQNDFPRAQVTVVRYIAPPPARSGKPRRLKITRQGSRVTVSWGATPLAHRYEVTVTVGRSETGLRIRVKANRRRLTFIGTSSTATVLASVQAFTAEGVGGPVARVKSLPRHRRS